MSKRWLSIAIAFLLVASVAGVLLARRQKGGTEGAAADEVRSTAGGRAGPSPGLAEPRPQGRVPSFSQKSEPNIESGNGRPNPEQLREMVEAGDKQGRALYALPGTKERALERLPRLIAKQEKAEEMAYSDLHLTADEVKRLREIRQAYFAERRRLAEDFEHADRSGFGGQDQRVADLEATRVEQLREVFKTPERYAEFEGATREALHRIAVASRGQNGPGKPTPGTAP